MSKGVNKPDLSGPIIIGGVGGSGTRVVTMLLQSMGVYMGSYRTSELDSVFFSQLVTARPDLWKASHRELAPTFDVFTRLHLGKILTPGQVLRLVRIVDNPKFQFVKLYLHRAYISNQKNVQKCRWGWKNPRTQFFLQQLSEHYSRAKYIHVMRNGLDMAFSNNLQQLEIWGKEFGVDPGDTRRVEQKQVDFWIAVNRWVLSTCEKYLPGRYHIVSFDNLCAHPRAEIESLMNFLGPAMETPLDTLIPLVQTPSTIDRYKPFLHLFTQDQIQAVRDLGFPVGE